MAAKTSATPKTSGSAAKADEVGVRKETDTTGEKQPDAKGNANDAGKSDDVKPTSPEQSANPKSIAGPSDMDTVVMPITAGAAATGLSKPPAKRTEASQPHEPSAPVTPSEPVGADVPEAPEATAPHKEIEEDDDVDAAAVSSEPAAEDIADTEADSGNDTESGDNSNNDADDSDDSQNEPFKWSRDVPEDMKSKLGFLPTWAWIALILVAALAAAIIFGTVFMGRAKTAAHSTGSEDGVITPSYPAATTTSTYSKVAGGGDGTSFPPPGAETEPAPEEPEETVEEQPEETSKAKPTSTSKAPQSDSDDEESDSDSTSPSSGATPPSQGSAPTVEESPREPTQPDLGEAPTAPDSGDGELVSPNPGGGVSDGSPGTGGTQ